MTSMIANQSFIIAAAGAAAPRGVPRPGQAPHPENLPVPYRAPGVPARVYAEKAAAYRQQMERIVDQRNAALEADGAIGKAVDRLRNHQYDIYDNINGQAGWLDPRYGGDPYLNGLIPVVTPVIAKGKPIIGEAGRFDNPTPFDGLPPATSYGKVPQARLKLSELQALAAPGRANDVAMQFASTIDLPAASVMLPLSRQDAPPAVMQQIHQRLGHASLLLSLRNAIASGGVGARSATHWIVEPQRTVGTETITQFRDPANPNTIREIDAYIQQLGAEIRRLSNGMINPPEANYQRVPALPARVGPSEQLLRPTQYTREKYGETALSNFEPVNALLYRSNSHTGNVTDKMWFQLDSAAEQLSIVIPLGDGKRLMLAIASNPYNRTGAFEAGDAAQAALAARSIVDTQMANGSIGQTLARLRTTDNGRTYILPYRISRQPRYGGEYRSLADVVDALNAGANFPANYQGPMDMLQAPARQLPAPTDRRSEVPQSQRFAVVDMREGTEVSPTSASVATRNSAANALV